MRSPTCLAIRVRWSSLLLCSSLASLGAEGYEVTVAADGIVGGRLALDPDFDRCSDGARADSIHGCERPWPGTLSAAADYGLTRSCSS